VSDFDQIVAPMQDEFPWGDLLAAQTSSPPRQRTLADSVLSAMDLVEEALEAMWDVLDELDGQ
jgi:hypothetical protein